MRALRFLRLRNYTKIRLNERKSSLLEYFHSECEYLSITIQRYEIIRRIPNKYTIFLSVFKVYFCTIFHPHS